MRGGASGGTVAVSPSAKTTLLGSGTRPRILSVPTLAAIETGTVMVDGVSTFFRRVPGEGGPPPPLFPAGSGEGPPGSFPPRQPDPPRGLAAVPRADVGPGGGVRSPRLGPLGAPIARRVRLLDGRPGALLHPLPAADGDRGLLPRRP